MRLHPFIFLAFALFVLSFGCSSTGKKALEKGQYVDACKQAIAKLRSSPTNKKAALVLTEAYPLAVNHTDTRGAYLSAGSQVLLYGNMNDLAVSIANIPAARAIIPDPKEYKDEYRDALERYMEERRKLAEGAYVSGMAYFNLGTRDGYRKAYGEFKHADEYVSGYKDVNQKIKESLKHGTFHVAVELVPFDPSYHINTDFITKELFKKFPNTTFFSMYSSRDISKFDMNPDYLIRLSFSDLDIVPGREASNTKELTRDSVVVGSFTDKRGQTYDVFGTVKATLTVVQLERIAKCTLGVQTIDYAKGTEVSYKSYSGAQSWTDFWGTYVGDDRALTEEEYATCKRKPMPPPPAQELFVQIYKPISASLYAYISDFVSGR